MLRLLRTITIVFVIIIIVVLDNASIVRLESPRFCGYSSKTSTCPGDRRVEIMSPFWIENHTSDDDGDCISYPGFQVICAANRRPVINISNYLYYVLSTDDYYKGGSFTVVDVVIDAQECPQPRRNISIESTRFIRSYGGTVNMTFFYNCSRYQQNVLQHMPCLDNNNNNTSITGRRSFAFLEEEISGHKFDWYENCEEAVMVPVGINGNDPTSMNYTESLKRGFRLYWDYPVNCGNCELSGGKCWVNETNQAITTTPFHCNCKDGTNRLDRILVQQRTGLA